MLSRHIRIGNGYEVQTTYEHKRKIVNVGVPQKIPSKRKKLMKYRLINTATLWEDVRRE